MGWHGFPSRISVCHSTSVRYCASPGRKIKANLAGRSSALFHNFDLKPLFIGSILLFEVGSAVCGAAPSMNALIVGRTIAGLGGSGIFLGYVHCQKTRMEYANVHLIKYPQLLFSLHV
jgi:hypothetical protein